jgi:hypothetical protein
MTRGLNIKVGPQEKNQENNAKGIYKWAVQACFFAPYFPRNSLIWIICIYASKEISCLVS